MIKKIKIAYTDPNRYKAVYIDWTLGNFCNFKCSYCPDYLHNGTNPMSDIEIAKKFIRKLFAHYITKLDKRYFVFNFLGGEPTLWKHLGDFVRWIKEYSSEQGVVSYIEILTNGSRTIRWWKDYVQYFDRIKITHHTEFANPEHTKTVANLVVDNNKNAAVQVTMIPAMWNTCMEHLEIISDTKHCFQIDVKPLRVDFGSVLYEYSDEQLNIFKTTYRPEKDLPQTDSIGMASKFILSDGAETYIRYQELITKKENTWLGWNCWAGLDIISITQTGFIKLGGACQVGSKIVGKFIHDEDLEFPTVPVICTQQWCSCGPDMETRKEYVE
jgi:organic radical activating enzyme